MVSLSTVEQLTLHWLLQSVRALKHHPKFQLSAAVVFPLMETSLYPAALATVTCINVQGGGNYGLVLVSSVWSSS